MAEGDSSTLSTTMTTKTSYPSCISCLKGDDLSVLPCSHLLCDDCVKTQVDNLSNSNESRRPTYADDDVFYTLQCPRDDCLQLVTVYKEPGPAGNHGLVRQLPGFKLLQKSEGKCAYCGCLENKMFGCINCSIHLCDVCKTKHEDETESESTNSYHIIVTAAKYEKFNKKANDSSCPKHPNSSLKLVCNDCAGPICGKCIQTDHEKHNLVELPVSQDAMKKIISTNQKEMIEFTDFVEEKVSEMVKHQDNIVRLLESRKAQYLADMEQKLSRFQKVAGFRQTVYQGIMNNCTVVNKKTDDVLNLNATGALIAGCSVLKMNIDEINIRQTKDNLEKLEFEIMKEKQDFGNQIYPPEIDIPIRSKPQLEMPGEVVTPDRPRKSKIVAGGIQPIQCIPKTIVTYTDKSGDSYLEILTASLNILRYKISCEGGTVKFEVVEQTTVDDDLQYHGKVWGYFEKTVEMVVYSTVTNDRRLIMGCAQYLRSGASCHAHCKTVSLPELGSCLFLQNTRQVYIARDNVVYLYVVEKNMRNSYPIKQWEIPFRGSEKGEESEEGDFLEIESIVVDESMRLLLVEYSIKKVRCGKVAFNLDHPEWGCQAKVLCEDSCRLKSTYQSAQDGCCVSVREYSSYHPRLAVIYFENPSLLRSREFSLCDNTNTDHTRHPIGFSMVCDTNDYVVTAGMAYNNHLDLIFYLRSQGVRYLTLK